ncbi:MAG: MFS transporter, partial [Alphaproteobacteria bacterium]
DIGLLPDGVAAPPPAIANEDRPPPSEGPSSREATRTPAFWFLAIATFGMLWNWYAAQVHQTQFLLDVGFDSDMAALALAFVSAGGVFGQIFGGWLSDRIGREGAWSVGCLGFAVCFLCFILLGRNPAAAPNEALLWAMVAAQGLIGYGLTAVYASAPADLFQGRNYSTIFGILSVFSSLGGGAGPYVTGRAFDLEGSYETAFMIAIGWCLISTVAMWMAAPRRARQRLYG